MPQILKNFKYDMVPESNRILNDHKKFERILNSIKSYEVTLNRNVESILISVTKI